MSEQFSNRLWEIEPARRLESLKSLGRVWLVDGNVILAWRYLRPVTNEKDAAGVFEAGSVRGCVSFQQPYQGLNSLWCPRKPSLNLFD